ncbi:hypothetical protein [Umezawaea sp. NPDC059074]|uniref:hypothetical protein n=1 Tax=Umezawaea sp. NPDC059074 TaxID=3346716 RepID=UPI0036745590
MDKTLVELLRLSRQWLMERDSDKAPEIAEGMAQRFAELDRVLREGGNLPDVWAQPLRARLNEAAEQADGIAAALAHPQNGAVQRGMARTYRHVIKLLGLGK